MKITIEAEAKEIAALVKELEGKQTVVSKIKFDGDCNTMAAEESTGRSEVKQEANQNGIKVESFSDGDIILISKELGELSCKSIAAQVEEAIERRYDGEWLKQQAEYLFGTRAKAHAQKIREADRKKREAEQLKKEN